MLNCGEVIVVEENFIRNSLMEKTNSHMPVQLDKKFMPNKDEKINNAKLELHLQVGEKDSSEFPFYYAIKLAGIFNWEDKTVEDMEEEISQEGVEMLYSFIRTYFYDMLKKSELPALVLPSMREWKND
mgnify:CR=1 FL=1